MPREEDDLLYVSEADDEPFTHGIGFVLNDIVFHKGRALDRFSTRYKKITRFTALEVEIASARSYNCIERVVSEYNASIVNDGSLREGGFEINTAPAWGESFYRQIRDLTDALSCSDAKVDNCCGLHTHVDAADFTWYDIRKLIILWAMIERGVFCMLPLTRQDNTYCRPVGSYLIRDVLNSPLPHHSKSAIMRANYGTNILTNIRDDKHCERRYHAMNIHSWVYRKSIEFRVPPGTTKYVRMVGWAEFFNAVLNFAYKCPENVLRSQLGSKIMFGRDASRQFLIDFAKDYKVDRFVEERLAYYAHENEG